jgi:hypothetical protein
MGFAEMGVEAFMLKIALFEGRECRMCHGHLYPTTLRPVRIIP